MIKKLLLLSVASACSMSYAAPQAKTPSYAKATEGRPHKSPAKVRLVTLSDREVAAIEKAFEVSQETGAKAPLVAQYAPLIANGQREIERDVRCALMKEVRNVLGRETRR